MTRDEITKLLEIIAATYPHAIKNIKDPAAMATAWELALGDYSAEEVYKAARLHMNNSKFFPSPADIRERIARAQLIYTTPATPALEASRQNKRIIKDDDYLEELCKFTGLGYEKPDDNANLNSGFASWEI